MRRRIWWGPSVLGALVATLASGIAVNKSYGAEAGAFAWSWDAADPAREALNLAAVGVESGGIAARAGDTGGAGKNLAPAALAELVRANRDISFLEPLPTELFAGAALGHPKSNLENLRVVRLEYRHGHPRLMLADGREVAFGPEIFPLAAARSLLRALGYALPAATLARGLELEIAPGNLAFALHWEKAPARTSFAGFVENLPDAGKVKYRYALVLEKGEGEAELAAALAGPVGKSQRELRALGLVALWLGSHAFAGVDEGGVRWDFSLGASDFDSSVNLVAPLALADPGDARTKLAETKGEIELPILVGGGWKSAFGALTPADARWMLRRIYANAAPGKLEAWLRESGYPEPAVRVLSSRLTSRLNSLLHAFAVQDRSARPLAPLAREKLESISIPGLVRAGTLLGEIPGFPGLLAADPVREWMRRNGGLVREKVSALAAEMIAHAPFVGLEAPLRPGGLWHAGPGWVVRVERDVRANPAARKLDELFRVRDKVQVSLFLGIGMNGRVLGQTLWANLAPGWTRVYAVERSAGSERDARALEFFGLALGALSGRLDPAAIQPGESFAVKSGISANLIAGGNLKAYTRAARGAGYALAGIEWVDGTAAERRAGGGLFLVRETTRRSHFATKAYARAISRAFRVPVAHYDNSSGESEFSIYEKRAAEGAAARRSAEAAFADALEGEWGKLEEYFERTVETADFSAENGGYNFYFRRGRFLASSSRETLASAGKTEYLHVSRAETASERRVSDLWEGSECEATGLVLYTDTSRREVAGRALVSSCSVHDENALPGEAALLGKAVERLAGERISLTGARYPEHGPFRADLRIRFGSAALARLFQIRESEFHRLTDGALSGAGIGAELLKDLREFFATSDESAKMDLLAGWLARSYRMRFALLRLVDSVELDAGIADAKWTAGGSGNFAGPAAEALAAWTGLAGKNLLRGL